MSTTAEQVLEHAEHVVNEVWLPVMLENGVKGLRVNAAVGRHGGVYYRVTAQMSDGDWKSAVIMPYADETYRQPAALRLRDTIDKCNVLCRVLNRRLSR